MLKRGLALIANPIMGTWHLPGLDLPRVDSRRYTMHLHRKLTAMGGNRALALMRVGIMKAFKKAASLKDSKPEGGILFFDDTGQVLEKPTRSIFFPGSGIDRIRNFETGIRDLQVFMRAMLAQQSPELENGPISCEIKQAGLEETLVYLYRTRSTSHMLSSAWAKRLEDAYRLNIHPAYISAEARDFAQATFLPLISREVNGSREKIDTETASGNMRFTLTGQSYGGTFCQMVVNAIYEEMNSLRYTNDEIQEVFNNILVFNVSGAAFGRNKLNRPSPKTIFIEHELDFVGFQTDRRDIHPYFNTHAEPQENGIALSDNRQFYWLNFEWRDGKNPDGIVKPLNDVYGYHDLRGTLSALPACVRDALKISLDSGTKRLPPLKDLLGRSGTSIEPMKPRELVV